MAMFKKSYVKLPEGSLGIQQCSGRRVETLKALWTPTRRQKPAKSLDALLPSSYDESLFSSKREFLTKTRKTGAIHWENKAKHF